MGMKKKKKDGIVFDNTVYLTEENQKRFLFYMRLLQLLAILGGSYCFITVLIRCFNLNVINSLLTFGILIPGLIFFILFIIPAYDAVKIIISAAVYGGMFYHWFKRIENGFYLLENAVIERASKYYEFDPYSFVADYTTAGKDLTLILIIVLIPVTGLVAFSLLRGRLNWLAYIVMIIPVAVSFAMGVTPPEGQLVVYIVIFLFLTVSNGLMQVADYPRNKPAKFQQSMIYRVGIKSALVLCFLLLALFFSLKLVVPAKQYEKFNKIDEAKSKIQNRIMNFSWKDVSDKIAGTRWKIGSNRLTSSGGLNLGKLGKVDQVVYDNTEHLLLKAPLKSVSEGIYLKGYVGSVYTGDSWETHTDDIADRYERLMEEFSESDYEPAMGSSIFLNYYPYSFTPEKGRIAVTYLKADSRFAYAPYFTLFTKNDGVRFEYDLAPMAEKEIKTGTYDYFYNLMDGLNDNFKENFPDLQSAGQVGYLKLYEYIKSELQYRAFVYETYTKLPEKGLERLKKDFSREAVGRQAENLTDAISYIKDYLYNNTRYTLSPGRLPRDKDFVEYFLYESKLGYCVHYASAGVLMLRAMGYPARYVEGYAINRSDLTNSSTIYLGETDGDDSIVEIYVKDYNAHAWAEVYFDGFGWIPVEFTVGSGMNDMAGIMSGIDDQDRDLDNAMPTPAPTNAPANPRPEPEETSGDEDIPLNSVPNEENQKQKGNAGNKAGRPAAGFGWLWVVIAILILTAAVITYILKRKKDNADDENFSRRALRLYEKIERLFIAGDLLPQKSGCLEESEKYVMEHLTFASATEFEECMDIARKARFGRKPISYGEYLNVEDFYNKLYEGIYNSLPLIKRLRIKLISFNKKLN